MRLTKIRKYPKIIVNIQMELKMYKIITDEIEIKKNQEKIMRLFLNENVEEYICVLKFPKNKETINNNCKTWNGNEYVNDTGYKGVSRLWWSNKYNMWISFRIFNSNSTGKWRYWNAYGLDKPKQNMNMDIIAEINYPIGGLDGHIKGAFVKNDGKIYLIHQGGFKIGTKNLNPDEYITYTKYQIINVEYNRGNKNVVLIGEIDDPDFIEKLCGFIKEVHKFRNTHFA